MSFRKPPRTAFKPGNPGGPGRPIGSRTKLNELALALLHKDFEQHGEDTIRRVRERKPEVYLASVVSLLPKQSTKLESPLIDLTDEELEQVTELLASLRAKTVRQLQIVAGKEVDPKDATQLAEDEPTDAADRDRTERKD